MLRLEVYSGFSNTLYSRRDGACNSLLDEESL